MTLSAVLCDDVLLAVVPVAEPLPRVTETTLDGAGDRALRVAALNFAAAGGGRERTIHSLLLLAGDGIAGHDAATVVLGRDRPRAIALPPATAAPGEVIDAVRGDSVARGGQILDFLMNEGWQRSERLRASGRAVRVLRDLLARTARPDGAIEHLAALHGAGTLFQGRARHLDQAISHVVLESDDLVVEACRVATLDARHEAGDEARAVLLFVASPRGDLPPRHLYFRREDGWHRLDVPDDVRRLDGAEAVEHLRALIPRLRADERTVAALRRMTRATYQRRDTLADLDLPVRLVIDRAFVCAQGVFLDGWLLDPRSLTRSVTLRSLGGLASRLDGQWVRIGRGDVTEAFRGEPRFSAAFGSGADDRHGFMVFVRTDGAALAGEHFFIEIELQHGALAFVPVETRHCSDRRHAREVLAAFNYRDPQAGTQLREHLAPFLKVLCAGSLPEHGAPTAHVFGVEPTRDDCTIVIPLTGDPAAMDLVFAQLAINGEGRGRRLIVVSANESRSDVAARLARLAAFYELTVTGVHVDPDVDRVSALRFGVEHAGTRRVLTLGTDVHAATADWLTTLLEVATAHPDAAFVSPTLLYEDESVRFAGRLPLATTGELFCVSERPPGVLCSRFDGYPREWVAGRGNEPVAGAALECCLLHRDRFLELCQPDPPFLNADVKEAVLWHRAAARGLESLWVSGVVMTALDDERNEHWQICAEIVDYWNLHAELAAPGIATAAAQAPALREAAS